MEIQKYLTLILGFLKILDKIYVILYFLTNKNGL